jgi:hypothetical protein
LGFYLLLARFRIAAPMESFCTADGETPSLGWQKPAAGTRYQDGEAKLVGQFLFSGSFFNCTLAFSSR